MAKAKRKQKPSPDAGTARAVQIEVMTCAKDNPDWTPGRDGAKAFPKLSPTAVNVRESAVETLFARGELTKLQKKAADDFRLHFETFAADSVGAMDYSRDVVDGGRTHAPTTPQRSRARLKLGVCRQEVGSRNYALLVSVCGRGQGLPDLFPGDRMKRQRLTAADNLRAALQDTAMCWGLASPPRKVLKKREHASASG